MPHQIPSERLAWVKEQRALNRGRALQYLGGMCLDCGEADPIVLQFHHRNPENKTFNLAHHWLDSWEVIVLELEKCDLICANCHLRRHRSRPNGLRRYA